MKKIDGHRALRVFVLGLSVCLSGCGLWNTAYRSESAGDFRSISVDAKQRFAFFQRDPKTERTVVCPEPSPDALSAGAVSFSIDGSKVGIADLKAALASSEQAASIGLRTQSIQLLRDQLAYMCLLRQADPDAQANLAQHILLFKRYQTAVLGVLAIEQLTGAVKAPPMTVNATGTATVNVGDSPARSSDMTTKKDEAAVPDRKEGSTSDSSSTAPASQAAPSEKSNVSDKKSSTNSLTVKAQPKVEAAGHIGSGGTANVAGADDPPSSPLKSSLVKLSDTAAVAQTVYNIVSLITMEAFPAAECAAILAQPNPSKNALLQCPSTETVKMENSVCLTKADPISCAKEAEQAAFDAAKRENPSLVRTPAVAGDIARNLKTFLQIPAGTDLPFNALRFGIFRCNGTPKTLTDAMIHELMANHFVARSQIADRGSFTPVELTRKGFTPSPAQVLYDADGTEKEHAATLVSAAQTVLTAANIKTNARSDVNTTDRTPLYLSVLFCPNA